LLSANTQYSSISCFRNKTRLTADLSLYVDKEKGKDKEKTGKRKEGRKGMEKEQEGKGRRNGQEGRNEG
jgi:hypothetical protein